MKKITKATKSKKQCPNLKQLRDIALSAVEDAQQARAVGIIQATPTQQLVVALMNLQSHWDVCKGYDDGFTDGYDDAHPFEKKIS